MKKLLLLTLVSCLYLLVVAENSRDHLFIYSQNNVVANLMADSVDSIAIVASRQVKFFDSRKNVLYSALISKIDSIICMQPEVKADIIDIEFLPDGGAKNVASKYLTVDPFSGSAMSTYFDSTYNRWACHFNHDGSTVYSGFYKVDYSSSPSTISGLADGHTLECVFRSDILSDGTKELKMFSSMEKGGTGFLITKSTEGATLAFNPNITTNDASNWLCCSSGINPVPGRYYHVVGVYDSREKKIHIYVDGQLKNSMDAPGVYFMQPSESARWFGIGGDASTSNSAQASWKGDVVIARVYDEALTADDVKQLYAKVDVKQDYSNFFCIHKINFPVYFTPGSIYTISGTGFQNGDVIHFQSINNPDQTFAFEGTPSSSAFNITIPQEFPTGTYRVMVSRGDASYVLGQVNMKVPSSGSVNLNGKKVAFVGNSHIYYGGVVYKNGQNAPDYGLFYQLCKNHGWNTTVYDLTWGGKLISEIVPLITLSASVRNSIEYVFFNQPIPDSDQATFNQNCAKLLQLFPNARFYYLLTYYNEDSSTRKNLCTNMVNSLSNQGFDIQLIRWGQLCTDLIKGNVRIPGGKYTYSASSFKISDQSHPNPLSGYIQAQAAFTKVTGCSAVGEDYNICRTASYGAGTAVGLNGYINTYYDGDASKSNFDDIFETESEMQGLQLLIDTYCKK